MGYTEHQTASCTVNDLIVIVTSAAGGEEAAGGSL